MLFIFNWFDSKIIIIFCDTSFIVVIKYYTSVFSTKFKLLFSDYRYEIIFNMYTHVNLAQKACPVKNHLFHRGANGLCSIGIVVFWREPRVIPYTEVRSLTGSGALGSRAQKHRGRVRRRVIGFLILEFGGRWTRRTRRTRARVPSWSGSLSLDRSSGKNNTMSLSTDACYPSAPWKENR